MANYVPFTRAMDRGVMLHIYHVRLVCKKMHSPKIIGTILTLLEWSYSYHIKTKKYLIHFVYILQNSRNSVRGSKLSL